MKHNFYRIFILFALLQVGYTQSQAQTISFTGTPYTQDFNTLPSTTAGTSTYTVSGLGPFQLSNAPVNASGLNGWYFTKVAGSGANALFRVDDGNGNSGSVYSYGVGTSTDRSLGSLASGSVTPRIGAIFTNNTSSIQDVIVLTATGIQWRSGASVNLNTLTFEYALNETSVSFPSGTRVSGFDVTTLTTAGAATKLDGSQTIYRTNLFVTIVGLNWSSGQNLVIRWTDRDEVGSDDGLAIDNFYLGLPPVNTTPTVLASPLNVNFGNQTIGATNFDFDLTVSGVNLTGSTLDVVSNIPGVTLLLNGTGTGLSMISLPIVSGSVDPTRIVYGLSVSTSSSTGPVSGTVDITTTGVALQTVTLTANIIGPAPYLSVSPSALDFGSILAGTSSVKSFTLSGFNLTSDLTISGLSGVFEVSANGIDGFWPSISITTGGPSFSGPISVKFLPNAASSFSGLVNCISVGATYDVSVSGAGFSASGTGKVTATNPESLGTIIGTNTASYSNIWRRGTTNQTIDLNFSVADGNINTITAQFPPQFSFASVTLLGSAFTSSSVVVSGKSFTVSGANLTSTSTGVVELSGVTIPSPSNLGKYNPIIATADNYGPIAAIPKPTIFVTIPISNIRDAANLDANGGFVPGVLGDSAVIEANSQIPTQAYASSNGTFNSLQVYIRDNSAAISIFRNGNAYPGFVTTGTGMIVKGNLSVFNNANQLTVTADRNIILTGNTVPVPPLVVTIAELVLNPEAYEGNLITIKNASLTSASNPWPVSNAAATLNITDDASISTTNLRLSYVTSIPTLAFGTTSPAFPADITGIFTQAYFSTPSYASVPNGYQIIPLKISDIVPVVATSNASNAAVVNQLAYPNPMETNDLFVYNPDMGGIRVFNGVGAEVAVMVSSVSSYTSKVMFPESSAGIYYVSIQGKNQPTVIKVIK